MVYAGEGSSKRDTHLVRLPMPIIDDSLMAEAQTRKGHISVKAVSDEYDRLLAAKLEQRSIAIIDLPLELTSMVDNWAQARYLTRPEAFRQLVEQGLKAEGK